MIAATATAAHSAQRAWPDLRVEDFEGELARRFRDRRVSADTWLERLQPADLYLATACARRIPGAAKAFTEAHGTDLRRTARRFADARHPEEDLLQLQLEVLLVGTRTRGPRIAEYSGQGHLQNWLRVTTSRLCIDTLRSGAQHRREDPGVPLSAADLGADLELDFLEDTYRAHFRAAFAEAVVGLAPAERTALRLAYVHGLCIDAIGQMHGVHRATAARRVARAREELLTGLRAALRERLEVPDADLDSILRLVGSRPEVSLERLLRSTLG